MVHLDDLKNLSILYADDDDILRVSTASTLGTLFNNVYSAKNGADAMTLYENHHDIHIIMLDIKMGSMSGIEVAKHIRRTNQDIPIFLVSSYTEVHDLLESIKLHLVNYLQKPVTFKQLTDVFLECLRVIQEKNILVQRLCDEISYDPRAKEVISHGRCITLSKNEIFAIELLLEQRGCVIPYHTFTHVMGDDVSEIAIKNTMSRLRKKLNCTSIHNIATIGYKLS